MRRDLLGFTSQRKEYSLPIIPDRLVFLFSEDTFRAVLERQDEITTGHACVV